MTSHFPGEPEGPREDVLLRHQFAHHLCAVPWSPIPLGELFCDGMGTREQAWPPSAGARRICLALLVGWGVVASATIKFGDSRGSRSDGAAAVTALPLPSKGSLP